MVEITDYTTGLYWFLIMLVVNYLAVIKNLV